MNLPHACRAPGDPESQLETVNDVMHHVSHKHSLDHLKVRRVIDRGGHDWLCIELTCPTFGGEYWFWGDGTVMQVL